MKKAIKVAVLSVASMATVLVPLGTTLADTKSNYGEDITKTMENMKKEMDNMMKKTKASFPSQNFSLRSDDYSSRSILNKHHPYYSSNNHRSRHVDHKRQEQNHYHVERKIYRHVERKTTTHRHIHEHHVNHNNSGDTLAAGIIGLAAGAVLGNVLKQPEQPQTIYWAVPQNRVVYQQVPQNQVIYEVPSTTTSQPLQQAWTRNWLQYCKKKYRSFNPKTGTFQGYDGLAHFCYAPLN
ncbi:hypothetical protein HNQ69_000318 [Bartonella callosciuri]|uniref:Lectin-like protein BA14k n=1 Tax=Bartonella callosciuri TaxID=686223 RepID=A0A840NNU0_9HYPH|nr:BA14K family protein [Bartonella callosciuri]MBB5073214.1 hypothetical protein [Bartonella callosciuri]